MQVLKEYVRSNIVVSAKAEFLSKGYTKASMRDIADQAGITVGNIYRYYESKEYLFETIVNPAFLKMNHLIEGLNFDDIELAQTNGYVAIRDRFTAHFMSIIKEHKDELVILIHCAEGTKYKNSKNLFAQTIEAKISQLVKNASTLQDKPNDNDVIARVISKNVVEGLTEIVIHNGLEDMSKLQSDVKLLLDLYLNNLFTNLMNR